MCPDLCCPPSMVSIRHHSPLPNVVDEEKPRRPDRYVDRTLPGDTLDIAPYRTIWGCFRLVTARNRLVTVDFDHRCSLLGGISLATARKREKKQGRRKRKRETFAAREPRDNAAD
ncbi:hypothetical protein GW17_00015501 [Ensete ventricosum]|nr:hypothetical protein GW17_00015501 [Ensete ventricosum]